MSAERRTRSRQRVSGVVREAREYVHDAFDWLWEEMPWLVEFGLTKLPGPVMIERARRMRIELRPKAYAWLSDAIGERITDIDEVTDLALLRRIYEACRGMTCAKLRDWIKANTRTLEAA